MEQRRTGGRRRRLTAVAGVAAAVLAVGGLTGCEEDGLPVEGIGSIEPTQSPDGGEEATRVPIEEVGEPEDGDGSGTGAPIEEAEVTEEPAGDGGAGFMAPGEMYRYANGLEVTVWDAEPYTPSVGSGHEPRIYRFRVTVYNYGDTASEAIFGFRAHAGGMEAVEFYDPALAVEPVGALAPGEHFEAYVVFDVPEGPELLDVTVDPLGVELETLYWTLPL